MSREIVDFEVTIGAPSQGDEHPVQVRVSSTTRKAMGLFKTSFTASELNQANQFVETGDLTDAIAARLGGQLFNGLFAGAMRQIYGALKRNDDRVRLRLVLETPELLALPWELLYDPDRQMFLASGDTVVREIARPTHPVELLEDDVLRILVVESSPNGTEALDGRAGAEGIVKLLSPAIRRGRIEVQLINHVTLESLSTALWIAENRSPPKPIHVVHFFGHSTSAQHGDPALLLFENDQGGISEVGPSMLGEALEPYKVRMVFLNSCASPSSTALDTASAFAGVLFDVGILAVLGMRLSVDSYAIRFLTEFYAAVAANQPVDLGLSNARNKVDIPSGHRPALGTPVVYLRSQSGRIVDIKAVRSNGFRSGGFAPWLRANLHYKEPAYAVRTFLVALGLLLGLWESGTWVKERYFDPPPRMTGEFNIAVAEFGIVEDNGDVVASEAGFDLAQNFTDDLKSYLSELTTSVRPVAFAISGPAAVGRISGSTQDARAREVADLAGVINADVVIYGNLSGDSTSSFQPEFYIRADRFVEGSELAAQHGLGSAIRVDGDPTRPGFAALLRQGLQARIEAMAEFVLGLGWYIRSDYEEAEIHFARAAAESSGWPAEDGKEVAYLFLGNVQGILGHLNEAEASYNTALGLTEGGYWRALLGLAEVTFQRSRGECTSGTVDMLGLDDARHRFQAARNATIQPTPVSLLTSGSDFGVARVLQCIAHTGDSELIGTDVATVRADATHLYELVISAYENTDPELQTVSLRERAAESLAGIGFLLLTDPSEDSETARHNREHAATLLSQAGQLTTRPAREAVIRRLLGFTQSRLDRCSEAIRSYDQARGLLGDRYPDNYQAERSAIAASFETTGHCDEIEFEERPPFGVEFQGFVPALPPPGS